ncbi:MAG: hypothetical protein IT381_30130 [Deltaproteobacteria bacterium]|nr:hypothetical protein [Deltaproteobacteria bacterium]
MPESRPKQALVHAPVRTGEGRFAPGQTGNAGGRPAIVAEVRELAQSYCADAIATLHRLMTTSDDERVQVAAAMALLDRGIGRPVQAVQVTNNATEVGERERLDLSKLPPDEFQQMRALMMKCRANSDQTTA